MMSTRYQDNGLVLDLDFFLALMGLEVENT